MATRGSSFPECSTCASDDVASEDQDIELVKTRERLAPDGTVVAKSFEFRCRLCGEIFEQTKPVE